MKLTIPIFLLAILYCLSISCHKNKYQDSSKPITVCSIRLSNYPEHPLKEEDIKFQKAFEEMKTYYAKANRPPFKRIFNPAFIKDFNEILKTNPSYEPALVNLFYFNMIFNKHEDLEINDRYLTKLLSINNDDPLYMLLKFSWYRKLVFSSFAEYTYYMDSPIGKKAVDSLAYFANHIYRNYDCYYLRIRTLSYATFKTFKERENALIKAINYIESENNREKLLNSLENFIEKYQWESEYFSNITQTREISIKNFLRLFYHHFLDEYSPFRSFLRIKCGIIYESLEEITPQFEKYPEKYRKLLIEEFSKFQ